MWVTQLSGPKRGFLDLGCSLSTRWETSGGSYTKHVGFKDFWSFAHDFWYIGWGVYSNIQLFFWLRNKGAWSLVQIFWVTQAIAISLAIWLVHMQELQSLIPTSFCTTVARMWTFMGFCHPEVITNDHTNKIYKLHVVTIDIWQIEISTLKL